MDSDDVLAHVHCARLATRLLLAGFRSVDQLAGLSEKAMDKITQTPKELSLLAAAVRDMDALLAQAKAQKIRQSLRILVPAEDGPRSADQLAATLTPEELARLVDSNAELQKQVGVRITNGLMATAAQLIQAKKREQGVQGLELLG